MHAKKNSLPACRQKCCKICQRQKLKILAQYPAGVAAGYHLAGNGMGDYTAAPITVLSPMVTPGSKIAPPPIHTLLPMVTGAVMVSQKAKPPSGKGWEKRWAGFSGW